MEIPIITIEVDKGKKKRPKRNLKIIFEVHTRQYNCYIIKQWNIPCVLWSRMPMELIQGNKERSNGNGKTKIDKKAGPMDINGR